MNFDEASLQDNYRLEIVQRTLYLSRLVTAVGLVLILYFMVQDMLIVKIPGIIQWRIFGFACVSTYLVLCWTLFKRHPRLVIPSYTIVLICALIMIEGITAQVIRLPSTSLHHKFAAIQGLTATLFTIFLFTEGARRYLPIIYGVPLAGLFLYLMIGSNLSVADWSLFSNPLMVGAGGALIGVVQSRMQYSSFRMRNLLAIREKELEEQLQKENLQNIELNKLLGALEVEIRERKVVAEKLERLAIIDDLTGLFNRRAIFLYLDKMLSLCKRRKQSLTICFLDIDGLKNINDTLGHTEGDAMLQAFAAALRESVRDSDCMGRIGGDEFLVILMQCTQQDAQAVIDRIQEKLYLLHSGEVKKYGIEFSYGIVEYDPEARISGDKLIELADKRMYQKKQEKRESLDTSQIQYKRD